VPPAVSRAARGSGARATGEKLRDVLQFAYASAVARKRPVVVHLSSERRRCRVTLRRVSLPWLETDEKQPETRTLATMVIPERVRLDVSRLDEEPLEQASETAWEQIVFRSNGRAADMRIVLEDDDERFEIEIVAATGQVRVGENR